MRIITANYANDIKELKLLALVGEMSWQKGQSGNPSGRPKERLDIAAMCRVHTQECITVLVTAMRKSPRERLPAALALLDRGWGKPRQQLEVSGGDDAIALHLLAARATVALLAELEADAQPATIEGRADSETVTRALDAPVPTE